MNGSETVCAGGERKDIFSWCGGCPGGPDSKVIYKQKRKGPSRCLQGHPARGENKQGRKRALVLGRASFRRSMRVQGYQEPVWRALEATVSAALAVTLGDRRNLWTWGLEAGPLWLLYEHRLPWTEDKDWWSMLLGCSCYIQGKDESGLGQCDGVKAVRLQILRSAKRCWAEDLDSRPTN